MQRIFLITLSVFILTLGVAIIIGGVHLVKYIVHHTKAKSETEVQPYIPFSVSGYFERIERAYLEILEEQEKEKPYELVLWWGFDGLRLKKDGTTEWISRRPKTFLHAALEEYSERAPLAFVPLAYEINMSTLNDTCWTRPANCSTEAQISALQSQLQAVNMQQWQNKQIQSMINQTQPERDISGRLRRYV